MVSENSNMNSTDVILVIVICLDFSDDIGGRFYDLKTFYMPICNQLPSCSILYI